MRSEKFKKLVERDPDNELFRFSLGQAYSEEGQHESAVEAMDACLERKPDWMMAAILKGKSLIALQRPEEAKLALQHALRLAIEQEHETPESEIRQLIESL